MDKIYQKPFLRRKNAGFTLIELLVVVLIIGILSAVALPQYQTAVLKSRAAELFVNVRSLRETSDLYYLANGVRPTSFLDLDIHIPYKILRDDGGLNYKENGLMIAANGNLYALDIDGYVMGLVPEHFFDISSWYKEHGIYSGGRFYCRVLRGGTERQKKAARQVCLSLGGVFKGGANGEEVYALY